MRWAVGNYELDDDPARIDPAAAAAFLTTEAYWGRWRTEHDIGRQIATAWRVIGAYDPAGAMVGLARAISDGGSAYLADVYVLSAHRGRGLGKAVVAMMVEEGPGAGFRWMLHTSDAYGLYRQFGFEPPPDNYMERPSRGVRGGGQAPRDRGASGGSGFRPPGSTQPLAGDHVRLEPLGVRHVPGLLKAAAQDPSLYQWVLVPQDEPAMRRHVEDALAARAKGNAVPFAVVRLADETVIGATRFHQLDYWARPEPVNVPDTCEIGYTWLAREALRTGANTEMKRLMLTYAFEVWRVRSVCLHTDVRNQRSQDAIRRIGGKFEGILRAHRPTIDQSPRDSARFSITTAEWPSVRQHLAELAARYPAGAARRQAAGQHPQ
jgi:RimJ/RimL family protein N-acetyltransferase/GNAT superfamily N-acetyltransferase